MVLIALDENNKVIDWCNPIMFKNLKLNVPDSEYFETNEPDIRIGDTFDKEKNESLKDSPQRLIELPKTELELIREEIESLKSRITELEK